MRLDGHSVGHSNVYALLARDGTTLIDVGWGGEQRWQTLSDLLTSIGRSVDDVTRVLLTHLHPDHAGLAGALQDRCAATVGMHRDEIVHFHERFCTPGLFARLTSEWLASAGAPGDAVETGLRIANAGMGRMDRMEPDQPLADGDIVESNGHEFVALHTPGHTAGHLSYYERSTRTLFSGDHVMSLINTGPAFRPQCSPDPVGDYLATFDTLRALDVDWVLPGHHGPFTWLDARLDQIRRHHHRRLVETRTLVESGLRTAWDVSSHIKRSREWSTLPGPAQITAMAETYAHLVHLTTRGDIRATPGPPTQWSL